MKSKELLTNKLSNEGIWKKVLFYYLTASDIPPSPYTLITLLIYTWP